MKTVSVDLRARRRSDLVTLCAIESELRALGVSCGISLDEGVPPNTFGLRPDQAAEAPVACDVRVIVEPALGTPAAPPRDPARALAVIWDSCQPPQQLRADQTPHETLGAAKLVLAPGSGHVQALSRLTEARIEVVGLARLDVLLAGTDRGAWNAQRAGLRREIGVFPQSALVVLAAVGDTGPAYELVSARMGELAAEGITVALLPEDCGDRILAIQRELAARSAGLVLGDAAQAARLVVSADLVAGPNGRFVWEAHGLGLPTIGVEPDLASPGPQLPVLARTGPELQHKIRVHLQGAAAPMTENDWLDRRGSAAKRIAFALRDLGAGAAAVETSAPPATAADASTEGEVPRARSIEDRLASIEARAAFGDDVDALEELRTLVATQPSVGAFRLLASLERKRKQFEAASDFATQAVSRGRFELAQALCERGRVEIEQTGAEGARGTFEEASVLAPELADPLVGLGTIALHTGDPTRAEDHFRRALSFEKSGRTWAGLGLSLADQGRHRDALQAFDASLDLDPECQAALYGVVQAGFHTGELRLAADRLTAYIEMHPGNLDFTFTLAGLLCQLGELVRGRELVERIAIFDPGYPDLDALRAKLGEG